MSHPANRSFSHYITSMATLLLRWTSSQVITVPLFTHGPVTDQPLVQDTTCTYPATLETTAIPTPAVAGPTPSPWVLFISLFLSILCRILPFHSHWCWSVLRDNNLVCLCKLVCWFSQLSRTLFGKARNESDYLEALYNTIQDASDFASITHWN